MISRFRSLCFSRITPPAETGDPPFDAVGLMQKFPELMQNGQVQQAEALLDRVSKMLGLEKAGGGTTP